MTRPARVSSMPEIPVDQIDRNQHADRRHHLGREHPEQDVLGALGRRKRHRPRRRNGDQHRDQRRSAGNDDRIERVMKIVAALLHRRVVLRGPVKEQEFRRHRERIEFGLEARQRPSTGSAGRSEIRTATRRPWTPRRVSTLPCVPSLTPPDSGRRSAPGRTPRCWRSRPRPVRRPRRCRRRTGSAPASRSGTRYWWSAGPGRRRW